ncbi:methionine adenosyltransferase 2 subunit beta-like [Triticum dicoccoides]|uniref:methionine adenosyltransferase 2 subunit beta-like n=1 Tax=Triticum dicoccoides TaxID=85692 RepID=UPI0018913E74|nr:methionine adenosyltransferase 2 subunit beta-like [Triticum dicoccoides]
MATNVPSSLVNWSLGFGNDKTLLIHLSTDQVYEGVKSFYKEEDETLPVNMYGKSKVAAEKFITEKCSNYAILRSSIIYGPQTISPVEKSLPVQWMNSVLSQGQQVDFFNDEYRCPVYVKDMVDVILSLTKSWLSDGKKVQVLLNVGGPDRVSRLQMAESVAEVRGYSKSIIKSVPASSVNRGVASPPDISMDITRLTQTLGIQPITFLDGVRATLGAEARCLTDPVLCERYFILQSRVARGQSHLCEAAHGGSFIVNTEQQAPLDALSTALHYLDLDYWAPTLFVSGFPPGVGSTLLGNLLLLLIKLELPPCMH